MYTYTMIQLNNLIDCREEREKVDGKREQLDLSYECERVEDGVLNVHIKEPNQILERKCLNLIIKQFYLTVLLSLHALEENFTLHYSM